jgi:WD40 repeat protein
VATRSPLASNVDDALKDAVFSPDGVLVATFSEDEPVRVWDIATGTALTLLGGLGGVIEPVFSPDGHTLLKVSSDGVVRIYPLAVYGSIRDMTEMASQHLNLVAR